MHSSPVRHTAEHGNADSCSCNGSGCFYRRGRLLLVALIILIMGIVVAVYRRTAVRAKIHIVTEIGATIYAISHD